MRLKYSTYDETFRQKYIDFFSVIVSPTKAFIKKYMASTVIYLPFLNVSEIYFFLNGNESFQVKISYTELSHLAM